MRVLVLGGTAFLGRHVVERALARGDEVTIFNRGRTAPGLFAGSVRRLRGDRGGDLGALRDGSWDAAIDLSGYVPGEVRASSELLAERVEQLTFVAEVVWRAEDELLAAGVEPWSQLPLWIPSAGGGHAGFFAIDGSRAFAAGLTPRPLADTARDTRAALRRDGEPSPSGRTHREPGLEPELEARLVAASAPGGGSF